MSNCQQYLNEYGQEQMMDNAVVMWSTEPCADSVMAAFAPIPQDVPSERGKNIGKYLDRMRNVPWNSMVKFVLIDVILIGLFVLFQLHRGKLAFNWELVLFASLLLLLNILLYCVVVGKCSGVFNDGNKLLALKKRAQKGLTPKEAYQMFSLYPEVYIEGFQRVWGPPSLSFPEDHGMHFSFPTEWYYYVSYLSSSNDKFSVEMMFIRNCLLPPDMARRAKLTPEQNQNCEVILFICRQSDQKKFQARDCVISGSSGLVDFGTQPVTSSSGIKWKIGNNQIVSTDPSKGIYPLRFTISDPSQGIAADLTFSSSGPIILHGNEGFDPSGLVNTGIGSYYYSWTQIQTSGSIILPDSSSGNPSFSQVSGLGWMDHQMFSGASPLGTFTSTFVRSAYRIAQIFGKASFSPGWDYLVVQFQDGTCLMLEREHAGVDLSSDSSLSLSGYRMDAKGNQTEILMTGTINDRVQDPVSGGLFPTSWTITDGGSTTLTLTALVKDSLMKVALGGILYEGACDVTGTNQGQKVQASGWIEGMGYGDLTKLSRNILSGLQIDQGSWHLWGA